MKPEKKPIEAGVIARAIQGVKYVLTGSKPDEWFGPGQPMAPQAQNADGVKGRAFDFPVAANLRRTPRDGEATSFAQMRALADGYDLLRLVIETRKDQMAKMQWSFGLKKHLQEKQKAEKRRAAALAAAAKPAPEADPLTGALRMPKAEPTIPEVPIEDPRITELNEFFAFPDGEHDWDTWLRALLEDLLVIDAPTVYPRSTLGGGVHSLELVDGATIKRIIDSSGRTPLPPDPAYQQVLKGLPAVDYSRDELIYRPRNVRTNKVYGYSPVEQIIMTVNIALRRQLHQLQHYTEGNIPEAIVGVPPEWNVDQIKQFQEYWDSILEGNTAARRHMKFVPGGLNYQATKEGTLKDEFDEWLARVVCYAFSVSAQAFSKQMNRATAQTADDQAKQEGLQPIMNWVKRLMDYVVWKYFGYTDLEFSWQEEDDASPEVQMKVLTGYVAAKILTPDEARDRLGEEPLTDEQREQLTPPAPPGAGPVKPGEPQQPDDGSAGKPMGKRQSSGLRKVKRLSRDRASVKACTSGITDLVKPALAKASARVRQLLTESTTKAINASAGVKRLVSELTFEELTDLAPELAELLQDMAADGGAEALAQVIAEASSAQLSQVNTAAVRYAEANAAELVKGLEESTRDMLQGLVTQALEDGLTNDELASAIQDSYAFSDARAETIARTETANADVQGNLAGYEASGVVQGKEWIIAQDEYCDECNELNGVVVDLVSPFPNDGGDGPPLHPNCRCDVLPVLFNEEA